MVLRFLFQKLANNEQLVQRLSESYPIRRAAQITLLIFYRGKAIAERNDLVNPARFRDFFRKFNTNLKQEIESAKREMKRK